MVYSFNLSYIILFLIYREKVLDKQEMDTTKLFNFMLGVSGQMVEEAHKFKNSLEKEYNKILVIGSNNNSDTAIAIRELTEQVFVFLEDLKYKLQQG